VSDIRFYTDEHVPKAVIRGLRQRGVDVATVMDVGKMGASDLEHLRFAHLEQRVIFTQDDDFLRLAADGEAHAGIVYAAQHTSIRAMIHGLMLVYRVLNSDEMANQVEFL